MGRSSIKVIVNIYGHLVPGGNRQVVDKRNERVSVTADQRGGNGLKSELGNRK
jgi:hypothetical protein